MNNNIDIINNKIKINEIKPKRTKANISVLGIGDSGQKILNNLSNEEIFGLKKVLIATSEVTDDGNNHNLETIVCSRNDGSLITNSEFIEKVKETFADTRILIFTIGLGGKSAKTLIPLIFDIANELNIISYFVLSTPFSFEGPGKFRLAVESLEIIKKLTCSYTVISNEKLINNYPDVTMVDVHKLTNNAIKNCVNSFVRLYTKSTITNINFDDLLLLINNKKEVYIGFGIGVGKHKIAKAIESSLNSKIIDREIKNASNVLVNIIADQSTSIFQVNSILDIIKNKVGNENINILFNFDIDKRLRNEIQLNVIATWNNNGNYFDYKNYLDQENEKNQQKPVKIRDSNSEYELNERKICSLEKNGLNYDGNFFYYQNNNETNDLRSVFLVNDDEEDIPSFLK